MTELVPTGLVRTAASAGGIALATAARGIATLRPSAKPLHPRGEVVVGRLQRHGVASPTGVDWLDRAGEDEVLVRRSRAVGLPAPVPDVHGLALRVPVGEGAYGDLLLASTGWGRVGRFVLTASRDPGRRPLTTLLPYRSPVGPLLVGARVLGPEQLELACAVGAGEWEVFAMLGLEPLAADPIVSFDPISNRIPGLEQYAWVRRLREPAYAVARGSR
jgi:hypothetical protein